MIEFIKYIKAVSSIKKQFFIILITICYLLSILCIYCIDLNLYININIREDSTLVKNVLEQDLKPLAEASKDILKVTDPNTSVNKEMTDIITVARDVMEHVRENKAHLASLEGEVKLLKTTVSLLKQDMTEQAVVSDQFFRIIFTSAVVNKDYAMEIAAKSYTHDPLNKLVNEEV